MGLSIAELENSRKLYKKLSSRLLFCIYYNYIMLKGVSKADTSESVQNARGDNMRQKIKYIMPLPIFACMVFDNEIC